MLLRDKTAVVLGAGSIGGAVASAFAAEGARVGIVARSGTRLDALVRRIREAGGRAKAVRADALDEAELRTRTAPLFGEGGRVDIAFSAIGWDDVQGTPLVEMPLEPILHPVRVATQAQVVMAKVFAPPMIRAGAGVLMTITATPARRAFPRCGGFAVACAAVEGLTRSLAAELGPHGVRVVGLRSAGSPETIGEILEDHARGEGVAPAEFVAMLEEMTLLRRLPGLHDVGRMAAWLASEGARTLTGTTVNMTCGQVTD